MTDQQLSEQVVVFYRCFSVLFLAVGTICNILSVAVYSRKHMRQTSFAIYLLALAIVDMCITWIGNVRFILMFYNFGLPKTTALGFDIRETSIAMCRLHKFFTYYFLQLSSVILCMLNIDRFVGCVLVLRSSLYCTATVAKRWIILMAVVLFVTNSHFFIDTGYHEESSANQSTWKIVCESNPNNRVSVEFWQVYLWIDSILYSMLPFSIMIVCNFVIIRKIVRSRVRSGSVIVLSKSASEIAIKGKSTCLPKDRRIKQATQMLASERRTSFILLGVSLSFMVLTMPVTLLETFLNGFPTMHCGPLPFAIAYMLMYLNHVVNFFFYCLIGAKFRNELKTVFPFKYIPRRRNKINPNFQIATSMINKRRRMQKASYKFMPACDFTPSSSFENCRHYEIMPATMQGINPFVTTQVRIVNCVPSPTKV
jgi:hypothetical protein